LKKFPVFVCCFSPKARQGGAGTAPERCGRAGIYPLCCGEIKGGMMKTAARVPTNDEMRLELNKILREALIASFKAAVVEHAREVLNKGYTTLGDAPLHWQLEVEFGLELAAAFEENKNNGTETDTHSIEQITSDFAPNYAMAKAVPIAEALKTLNTLRHNFALSAKYFFEAHSADLTAAPQQKQSN
jgi:hypothetical protein